ncbi:ZnF_RBZ [Nesidiocoris tenuis]|nr:ZnF_RBZ [Nesidiocoris tenuis]
MQLFYSLKQKYPDVPDRLVSHCMKKAGGDENACRELLESPEFAPYRLRRPPSLNRPAAPDDSSARGDGGPSGTTAACSITRHAQPSTPRAPVNTPTYLHLNRGIHVLIQAQLQRKRNLELEIEKDQKKLEAMTLRRNELQQMVSTSAASPTVRELKEQISALEKDCIKLYAELDSANVSSSEGMKPISVRTELFANGGERISLGTEAWRCEMCTFRNHPLLNQCETCSMPRITLGIKAA